jgi:hypothetical protein
LHEVLLSSILSCPSGLTSVRVECFVNWWGGVLPDIAVIPRCSFNGFIDRICPNSNLEVQLHDQHAVHMHNDLN